MNLEETQELFWRAARREASAEQIVRCFSSGPNLSAQGRIEVYAGAFFTRQEKALRELLPKTHELLGAEFPGLARRYTFARPGRHAALERFTNGFPDFLETISGSERAAALAHLEVTRNLALRAPADPTEPLHLEDFKQLGPDSLLRVSKSAHLISTDAASLEAFTRKKNSGEGSPAETIWLLFFRKGFFVRHRSLASDEARAIEELKRGVTLAALCEIFSPNKDPSRRAHAVISTLLNDQLLYLTPSGNLS